MPTVTLYESAKLALNELVSGIIENIITVNRFYEILPFDGIDGNSLALNRENALGDSQAAAPGDIITAKNPATFTQVTYALTTLVGDAEVNGLIQATRSGDGNDQTAVQVGSKAKTIGRQYQNYLINGDASIVDQFSGLNTLVAASQTATNVSTSAGDALSFAQLDGLISSVKDKDGTVDYITLNIRTINSYYALLRNLGGARIDETVQLPSGAMVPSYRGIPLFQNDWVPITQASPDGTTNTTNTTIFAGTIDDGSRSYGIAGLTASKAAGISVVDVGEKEKTDDHIWRVKWYCGLANFSQLGLACQPHITN
jgi:hypothetical protein